MKLIVQVLVVFALALSPAGCEKVPARSTGPTATSTGSTPHSGADAESHSDRELILDAVIQDLLTNPDLEHARVWYGSPDSRKIALSKRSIVPWPPGYTPSVKGYEFNYVDPIDGIDENKPRQLGISVNHFVFPPPATPPENDPYHGVPIAVGLHDVGGNRGGGLAVSYSLQRKEGRWIVKYTGSERP